MNKVVDILLQAYFGFRHWKQNIEVKLYKHNKIPSEYLRP